MSAPSALIVVDAQVNMLDPPHPVHDASGLLVRLIELVRRARIDGAPVLFVRNCGGPGEPDEPGTPGWEVHPALAPRGSAAVDKRQCDSFEGTPLEDMLRQLGAGRVVIAGMQSEYCIEATCRGAAARGFEVTLVEDGHSTYASGDESASAISARVNRSLGDAVKMERAERIKFE